MATLVLDLPRRRLIAEEDSQMPNRLQNETSPYLLQHKDNPVEWYPWGQEALETARAQGKPILVSIGYSSCHWCHVMAHESFENPEIARLMNENFVNVKVDREERPDLDAVYMEAVQAMTGQGGWPLNVFLTPDGKPFYGGTYFPPEDRPGMPGFPRVLQSVAQLYREKRDEIERGANEVQQQLARMSSLRLPRREVGEEVFRSAVQILRADYDRVNGGFGKAPKFPQPMLLEFLLRRYLRTGDGSVLEMVAHTLDKMSAGGIYDQLGGGFARYSVDAGWLIPHFEKMLYDNAQLALCYLHSWQVTGNASHRRIATGTLDYILREMTSPEGGFYSAQDADSEGEEGRFYVWTPQEVSDTVRSEDAAIFNLYYDVTESGNFEGRNVLHTPRSVEEVARITNREPGEVRAALQRAREKLRAARELRVHPGKDEKVITSWNGLALQALSAAAAALGREDYLDAAVRNAELVTGRLLEDERLLRVYKYGRAQQPGFLEDYAFYANGLLSLYEATFDPRWARLAKEIGDTMLADFWDDAVSGFYDTGREHEQLFNRPRNLYDNAIPSGSSSACLLLLRLSSLFGDYSYAERAESAIETLGSVMAEHPTAVGYMLCAADFLATTPLEIAIVGEPESDDARSLLERVRARWLPNAVLALASERDAASRETIPLLRDRGEVDGRAAAYVCHNYVCEQPVTSAEELERQLDEVTRPKS